MNSIMEAARHPLALDAILSMWLSPRSARPFGQLAAQAAAAAPACLIYGKEDPWVRSLSAARLTPSRRCLAEPDGPRRMQVVPLWGQRLRRLLPEATAYYEISPAGHCPHHEAPEAVLACMRDWLAAQEAGRAPALGVGEQMTVLTHVRRACRRACVRRVAGARAGARAPRRWRGLVLARVLRRRPAHAAGVKLSAGLQDGRSVAVAHVAGRPRTLVERAEAAVTGLPGRLRRMASGSGRAT